MRFSDVTPQGGGLLGTVGAGAKGLLGLPFAYVNAISSGLQDIPRQRLARAADREQAQALPSILAEKADRLGMSPEARLLAMTSPAAFIEALQKGLEPATLSGGQTRLNPFAGGLSGAPRRTDVQTPDAIDVSGGLHLAPEVTKGPQGVGSTYTAPVLGTLGDQTYTQTANGAEFTGRRAPTFDESEKANQGKFDRATAGMPSGFHAVLGPDGQPTGQWTLDPNYRDFKLADSANGATRVSTNVMLPAQNEFAKAFATQYAADLSGARTAADKAQQGLGVLGEAKTLLDSGKVLTGAGAEEKLFFNRMGSAVGNAGAKATVEATQVFQNQMKSRVIDIARQLGTGSGVTDSDRKFAEQIVGGDITLDKGTLGKLIDIQQRQANHEIQKFKSLGQEAFSQVPSAQGLPRSAFGPGVTGQDQSPGGWAIVKVK